MTDIVRIQNEDFDVGFEVQALHTVHAGAMVHFVGYVRTDNAGETVSGLTLEHYPQMTEKTIKNIVAEAKTRWDILGTLVIHRIGALHPGAQIVLVAVSSAHRGEAFAACEFIMDFLKTQAPFWKKEKTSRGERWLDARESDAEALEKWQG